MVGRSKVKVSLELGRWLKGNQPSAPRHNHDQRFRTISFKSVSTFSNDLGPSVGRDKPTPNPQLFLSWGRHCLMGGLQMRRRTRKYLEEATGQWAQTQAPPFLPPSLPVVFPQQSPGCSDNFSPTFKEPEIVALGRLNWTRLEKVEFPLIPRDRGGKKIAVWLGYSGRFVTREPTKLQNEVWSGTISVPGGFNSTRGTLKRRRRCSGRRVIPAVLDQSPASVRSLFVSFFLFLFLRMLIDSTHSNQHKHLQAQG